MSCVPPSGASAGITAVGPARHRSCRARIRGVLLAAARLLVLGVVFGWFYAWASPTAYPSDRPSGFGLGMVHGALMPMALPSLLLGQDVPIYAPRNSGRSYKLGYIAGINLCGLVFFGGAFWRPRPGPPAGSHSQGER